MSGKHGREADPGRSGHPCCRGRGSRCVRPRPRDADAARRIGLHPEILRLFGDEPEERVARADARRSPRSFSRRWPPPTTA